MKIRITATALLLGGCLLTLQAAGAQTYFVAALDSTQAGTSSTASGRAIMVLNEAQDALTYDLWLAGLDLDGLQTVADPDDDVTALHFHNAPPGNNGGVVFGLIGPNHDTDDLVIDPVAGRLTGVWEETDSNPLGVQLTNLQAGDLYLNVHTTGFGGGAIRGQVLPAMFADGFESGDLSAWSSSTP